MYRDGHENELRLDLIGEAIKQARKERNLTQTQLGELHPSEKSSDFKNREQPYRCKI